MWQDSTGDKHHQIRIEKTPSPHLVYCQNQGQFLNIFKWIKTKVIQFRNFFNFFGAHAKY